MGTRNLTAVYIDGEYKIAQYGQWDGYPSGQGMTALEFARSIVAPSERAKFADKVRKARWITKSEIDSINARVESGELKNWPAKYPELSRDTGAEILHLVMEQPDGIALKNNIEFAADGVWCEWAWVIDLDSGTFEGYMGFNKKPLAPDERFYFLRDKECDNEYHGVRLVAKWNIDQLPSDDDFLKAFKEE